jgi:uncharacterized membrane protein
MNGWFIAYLILMTLSLGTELAKHGERREGTHNFWLTLITALIVVSIVYQAIKTGL